MDFSGNIRYIFYICHRSYLNNYRWQLNALNAPQAQKSVDDDEGYGEVNSFPRFGNPMQKRVEYDAINSIVSRLRPTYEKRVEHDAINRIISRLRPTYAKKVPRYRGVR